MMMKHLVKMPVHNLVKNSRFSFSLFNKFNAKKDYYNILGVNKKASAK